jgi:hypothetical protein
MILAVASLGATVFATVIVALIIAWSLVALINHLRLTPEEKAEMARKREARLAEEREWFAENRERQKQIERERIEAEEKRLASQPPPVPTPGLVIAGRVLLVIGGGITFVALALYDTGVAAGSQQVHNLGLMLNRLLAALCGLGLAFTGALCLIAEQLRAALKAH